MSDSEIWLACIIPLTVAMFAALWWLVIWAWEQASGPTFRERLAKQLLAEPDGPACAALWSSMQRAQADPEEVTPVV